MSDEEIVVSTDGSALGNPNGPMGWAWADHAKHAGGSPGHRHDAHGYGAGGATNGTNQIGELCAVLEALRAHPGPQPLLIESDSQYAINCATKWVHGWKKNGWRNAQKKPVKNAALIRAIDAEMRKRPGPVRFRWVKGHAGNAGNELVDDLARTYAGDCRSGAQDGYLPLEGWQSLVASEYADGLDVPPDVQLALDHPGQATAGGGVTSTATGRTDTPGQSGPSPDASGDDMSDDVVSAGDTSGTVTSDASMSGNGLSDDAMSDDRTPDVKQSVKQNDGMGISDPSVTPDTSDTADDETGGTSAEPAPTPAPSTKQPRPAPAAPQPAFRDTGLRVSGPVTFSPAPQTSPTYTGQPIPVHGYIEVRGTVEGDGTLILNGARFLIS